MLFFGHAASFTSGKADFRTGRNDQGIARGRSAAAAAFPATAAAGQGRPRRIHSFRSATSAAFSRPLGGILSSSEYPTARRRRLLSAWPASAAGPLSPPFRIASRESRSRPPLRLFAAVLWQEWQR